MILKIPATSANLGPGFDTLGLALELFNKVEIKPSKFFKLSINGYGKDIVPLRKNNTFVNIFNEHYQKLTGKKEVFAFSFENNIPLARGMGSSSSVIVGAIVGAYHMAGYEVDNDKVLSLALEYENHPDNITPAAVGGFISAIVEQNKVYYNKQEIDDSVCAVMCIPDVRMNTQKSRQALSKQVSFSDAVFNLSHSSFLTSCFMQKKYDMLKYAALDRLHQTQRMNNLKELFEVQKVALENGALMSTLSGSGSSFFSLTYKDNADFLKQKLEKTFPNFQILKLNFNNYGYKIN